MGLRVQCVKIVVFHTERERRMEEKKVWLVTGTGSGIGYELTKSLLEKGCFVSALTRNRRLLEDKLCLYGKGNLLCIETNLASEASVKDAVEETVKRFGDVDVLVNNAGYEKMGYIEEMDIKEIKEEFEINFFAPIRIMQLMIPIMRKKGGVIINISSINGTCYSFEGSGAYNTSKAALDSLSKTLSSEVEGMGISVTSLICGQFRTNHFDNIQECKTNLDVYETQKTQKRDGIASMNHHQRGDVKKLCKVIMKLAEMQVLPREIYVGQDAYRLGYNRALSILKNLERWEALSRDMDIRGDGD